MEVWGGQVPVPASGANVHVEAALGTSDDPGYKEAAVQLGRQHVPTPLACLTLSLPSRPSLTSLASEDARLPGFALLTPEWLIFLCVHSQADSAPPNPGGFWGPH